MKKYSLAVLYVALLSLPGWAQQTAQEKEKDKNKQDHSMQSGKKGMQSAVHSADREFMLKAAMGGMTEVKLGELASQRANNADVKQFGQQMVTDHNKANSELKDLATRKNVTLPADLEAKHKATHDRLMKLSGADFDREYMREMVKDHDQTVALFEKASQSSRDTELKNWAAQTLPTLRAHQKMARDLASKVGATVAETSKNGK
jgi:putative membrane protein